MIDTGRTVTVLGKKYPVQLDTGGRDTWTMEFRVDLGEGQELSADTFRGLQIKAAEFKDVRFNLPFTTKYGKDGAVTGFHAGNGSLLVRWGTRGEGGTSQEREYSLNGAMPRLSQEDRTELARLTEGVRAAQAALDSFIMARQFTSIRDAAQEARTAAAGLA